MAVTKIRKISSSVLLIVAIIAVVVFVAFIFGGYIDPTAAKPEPRFTDLLLYLSYGVFIVAVLVMLGFALWGFVLNLRTNPKKALGGLVVVVALAVLLGVTYAVGSTEHLPLSADFQQYNTDSYLKLSDMWLYSIYAVFGITIAAMIWGAVRTSVQTKK